MKFLKVIYKTLSFVILVYGLIYMILYFLGYRGISDDMIRVVTRTVFSVTFLILLIILVLFDEKKINLFTILCFLITVNLFPLSYMWKIVPIILFVISLILDKQKPIKMVGLGVSALCFLTIIAFTFCIKPWVESIRPELELASCETYFSPDEEHELKVELYSVTNENFYYLVVYSRPNDHIELGFERFKHTFTQLLLLQDNIRPDTSVRWIDNDTFEVNGEQYHVTDYLK